VHEMLAVSTFEEGKFVILGTRRGFVKKTNLMDFSIIRSSGIIAIELELEDELIDVRLTDGAKNIFLSTRSGVAIRFPETQVRSMGRTARGVRGITLRTGDMVVGMEVIDPTSNDTVVTVSERGFGKRTVAAAFTEQNRGGKGRIAMKTTAKNGLVVASRLVGDEHELMLITDVGKIIRMAVRDLSVIGRNTQGVRLIRLDESERVMAVEILAEPEEEISAQRATAILEPEEEDIEDDVDPDEEDIEDKLDDDTVVEGGLDPDSENPSGDED